MPTQKKGGPRVRKAHYGGPISMKSYVLRKSYGLL